MLNFENTKIAFSSKSNYDLRKSRVLYHLVSRGWLVNVGKHVLNFLIAIRFPLRPFVKPTIFEVFCGGETIAECDHRIAKLDNYNIGSILDYSIEGSAEEETLNNTSNKIIETIAKAEHTKAIPYAVFKVSGVASDRILERKSWHEQEMDAKEKSEWKRVEERILKITKTGYDKNVPVFIDAEDYAFQPAIDELAWSMMKLFNKKQVIVYNTIQAYRSDRYEFLEAMHKRAQQEKIHYGVKLVRGAYMEKERERAEEKGYPSPIHENKDATDQCFNDSLRYILKHLDDFALCNGTHNEASTYLLVELMEKYNIKKNDPRIVSAQLLGMSDHISYNLAHEGYNVAKYVPFGPVREMMPYLIRRAQENSSAQGQTSRELRLIDKELKARKK
jgi:proline dehydrogenase